MPSFLITANGERLCQFPAAGLDVASIVLEATPEESTPARLMVLGTRSAGGVHAESLTWFNDVLAAGTELSLTRIPSDEIDPAFESTRSDTPEGEAQRRELDEMFEQMDAGAVEPRSVPIPLPWQGLAFHVLAGDEVRCLAAVTEEHPWLSLNIVWDRWQPDTLWLSAGASAQGWPPNENDFHEWLDQRVSVDQRLDVTILGDNIGLAGPPHPGAR